MNIDRQLSRSQDISTKVSLLFQKRAKIAHEHFNEQLQQALEQNLSTLWTNPLAAASIWRLLDHRGPPHLRARAKD